MIGWWLDVEYFREKPKAIPEVFQPQGRWGLEQEYRIKTEGSETKIPVPHRYAPRDLPHPNRSHLFPLTPKA